MKEGTVLGPPFRPCAYRDDDVSPVQDLSHFAGAAAAGAKTLWVFKLLLNFSPEPENERFRNLRKGVYGDKVHFPFCYLALMRYWKIFLIKINPILLQPRYVYSVSIVTFREDKQQTC